MLMVIGCGNPARSDDGAGIEVIRRLAQLYPAGNDNVRLIDAGTSGMEVMFQARHAGHTVIVDACSSGGEAGAVYCLPAKEAVTPVEHGYSMHGLRWDHALYAAQRMHGDAFLDHAEVFLIEAERLDYGLELSDSVTRGVEKTVAEIGKRIAAQ